MAAGALAGAGGSVAEAMATARGTSRPRPALARPPQEDLSSRTLRVGLIGCGGRGTGAVMQALQADDRTVLWALGDAFRDKLEACAGYLEREAANRDEEARDAGAPERGDSGERPPAGGSEASAGQAPPPGWAGRLHVPAERRFAGLDAYEKVLQGGADVVILATPPVFRPIHLAAAVEAGKHVFCEKPVAVDAPGVRSVLASTRRAAEQGLTLISGFCWRYGDPERATFARIQEGAIGELRAIYTTYDTTGFPSPHPRQEGWTDLEFQLRNWHYFHTLSGDHIVEQACHAIDWIAWAAGDRPPARCVAVGGRQSRPDTPETGNIFDHFAVTYEYDDGLRAFHTCRHFPHSYNDNSGLVLGSKGRCMLDVWKPRHWIEGETPWEYDGPHRNMYQNEHDVLFDSIRGGKARNDGERMARSTMMALLGRMAAYTGKAVTWEEGLASKEDLTPPVWAWGPLPAPPVARPGFTKFF